MTTFVVEVYQADGKKPTRSMVDVVYHFSVTPKEYVGSFEEKSRTTYHMIRVGISSSLFAIWNKIDYQKSNEEWLKILYGFAKRHITEKLQIGELSEYEEIDLLSYNAPDKCPFEPEKIPPIGQWIFEVELPDPRKYVEGEEEIHMRGIVKSFIAQMGQTLIIHQNWKQSDATSFEVRGLKNRNRGKIIFQFNERYDIKRGTVIQPKGTQDFWFVEDTEDGIIQDTFDYMNAFVTKITEEGKPIGTHKSNLVTVINYAPVYGQQIGDKNTQTVTVNSEQSICEVIASLKEVLITSSIPEIEKEDAIEALDRVANLAQKEKTGDVLERASSRIGVIDTIVSKTQSLYEKAQPAIVAIKLWFGLS